MDLKADFSYHQPGNSETFDVHGLVDATGMKVRVRLAVISPKDLAKLDFVNERDEPVAIPDGVQLYNSNQPQSERVPSTPLGPPGCQFFVVSFRTNYVLERHNTIVFALYDKAVQTPAVFRQATALA